MKDTITAISEKLSDLLEKREADARKLESQLAVIDGEIEKRNTEHNAAVLSGDFERAYGIKQEIAALNEKREYYSNGVEAIRSGKAIKDSGEYEKYVSMVKAEYQKAEAETIKKGLKLIEELRQLVDDHVGKCTQITGLLERLAAASSNKAETINPAFAEYIRNAVFRRLKGDGYLARFEEMVK